MDPWRPTCGDRICFHLKFEHFSCRVHRWFGAYRWGRDGCSCLRRNSRVCLDWKYQNWSFFWYLRRVVKSRLFDRWKRNRTLPFCGRSGSNLQNSTQCLSISLPFPVTSLSCTSGKPWNQFYLFYSISVARFKPLLCAHMIAVCKSLMSAREANEDRASHHR